MSNIPSSYIGTARDAVAAASRTRHQVIAAANTVLFLSKRVIFALHKGDISDAERLLRDVSTHIAALHKTFRTYPYPAEGAYRAAMEEYVEASLFLRFLQGKSWGTVRFVTDPELFLAGLCDVPGELYRHALAAVASGHVAQVHHNHAAAYEIYTELALGEFTQYLRTKFDQARGVMHKFDELRAQVALRTI
jgi:predicted translin family RNA/ssDNA-binding protein